MSAPAVSIPHESGDLSENQAIERMLARGRAGNEPEREDDPLEDQADPAEIPVDTDAPEADLPVEGDEFGEGEEQTTSADPVVKFDDGTSMPLSEVKRGFLRQQDYTRKTQEAAEHRKSLETERASFLAEKKQVPDRLEPLIQAALAIVNSPSIQAELAELRETDPAVYAVRVMEMQQKQSQLSQLQFEQHQLRESVAREEAETFRQGRAQTAEQSRAVLIEKIPAAKKDFANWYQGVGKYVLDQGIPAELWDNEVDHRIITLAWKAKQYDDATRKTQATGNQLRKAPQPLRPGAAKPPGHAQARSLREATEKAHGSGSIEDAIALQVAKQRATRR